MMEVHEDFTIPFIVRDRGLRRTVDSKGHVVFRLQDGTRVEHTMVNGNIHIFLRMDKCIMSVVRPNPDPDRLRCVIHYNHNESDCALSNMCWATVKQKHDYYEATPAHTPPSEHPKCMPKWLESA